MNIFKRIFGKKEDTNNISESVNISTKQNIESNKEIKSDKAEEDQYIKLAELLIESNNKEIIEKYKIKLTQLKRNPEFIFDDGEYYYDTKVNKFQAYRGNSKELIDNTEWFLLIDTLIFYKILWEFDWKAAPDSIIPILNSLSDFKSYKLPELDNIDSELMQSLDEYFRAVNMVLKDAGFVAINLYIDSDSYITGIVKLENLNGIIAQAEKCYQRITKYQ